MITDTRNNTALPTLMALCLSVGALAATPGVEPQLRSHVAASLRVGLSAAQLHQVTELLKKHGDAQTAERANAALVQALTASRK